MASANSSDWGKDSSRSEVVCSVCDKVMRKDNLLRHFTKCHPGKKESFKHKTVEGQKSLSSFFSSKSPGGPIRVDTSSPVKDASAIEEAVDDVLDISDKGDSESRQEVAVVTGGHGGVGELLGHAVRVSQSSQDSCYQSSFSEPSKKRRCAGTDVESNLASGEVENVLPLTRQR